MLVPVPCLLLRNKNETDGREDSLLPFQASPMASNPLFVAWTETEKEGARQSIAQASIPFWSAPQYPTPDLLSLLTPNRIASQCPPNASPLPRCGLSCESSCPLQKQEPRNPFDRLSVPSVCLRYLLVCWSTSFLFAYSTTPWTLLLYASSSLLKKTSSK